MFFDLMKQILHNVDYTKVSMMRFLGEEFSNNSIINDVYVSHIGVNVIQQSLINPGQTESRGLTLLFRQRCLDTLNRGKRYSLEVGRS